MPPLHARAKMNKLQSTKSKVRATDVSIEIDAKLPCKDQCLISYFRSADQG